MRQYARYTDTGNAKSAVKKAYTHYGNIYNCVVSFSGKEYFDTGMTDNYHTTPAEVTGNNKAAMLTRCERYPLFPKEENKDFDKAVDLWRN